MTKLRYKGGPGGLWGGGFSNCMAFSDPAQGHTAGLVVLGADTTGTHLSVDGGYHFEPQNLGKTETYHLKCVGIEFDPHNPNCVIMYTANGGDNGQQMAIWFGQIDVQHKTINWNKLIERGTSTPPAGVFISRSDGAIHPRQTGRAVQFDPFTAGRAFFFTNDGIALVTSTNAGWSGGTIALSNISPFYGSANPDIVHGICVDPNSTSGNVILYAAIAQDKGGADGTGHTPSPVPTHSGLAKFQHLESGGTPTAAVMSGTNSPNNPYGVVALNESGTTHIYVADGTNGILHYNGSAWSNLNITGATSQVWKGIDAVRVGSNTRVVVCQDIKGLSGPFKTAQYDFSSGWTIFTAADTSSNQNIAMGDGTVGPPWWLSDVQATYINQPSSTNANYPQIFIRPDNHNIIFMTGRSGSWIKDATSGDVNGNKWVPAMHGLTAAVCHTVATHPTLQGAAIVGDTDWGVHHSNTAYHTQPVADGTAAGPITKSDCRALYVRQDGLTLCGFLNGTVWSAPGPDKAWSTTAGKLDSPNNNWVQESMVNLGSAGAIIAVAGGFNAGGSRVLLAMSNATGTNGGIFIKTGAVGTAWTSGNLCAAGTGSNADRLKICWYGTDGSNTGYGYGPNVVAFDPDDGLYISKNYGSSWALNALSISSNADDYQGDLAVDCNTPSTIYLTTNDKVFKVNSTFGAGALSLIDITGTTSNTNTGVAMQNPGPITTAPGILVVHENTKPGLGAKLWASRDGGTSWTDVTSPEWRAGALFVRGIALDAGGRTLIGASYTSGVLLTRI